MIIETVNEYRFTERLQNDPYTTWTRGATKVLFDHYMELSEGIGEDIELDPVAIRCEWTEYTNAWEAMKQYQPDDMPTVDDSEGMDLLEIEEEQQKLAREWLNDHTMVLDVENVDITGKTVHSILVAEF